MGTGRLQQLADRARHARREVGAAVAIAVWAITVLMPRRVPHLGRLTSSADFAAAHAVAALWLGRQLELLEVRAPWLRAAGRQIDDRCQTSTGGRAFQRDPMSVTCTRGVWALYGFDGDLADRLYALSDALASIGWRDSGGRKVEFWARTGGPESWPRPLWWQPTAMSTPPSGLETMPPAGRFGLRSVYVQVGWASRGEPAADAVAAWGESRTRRAALLYQPVEVTDEDTSVLVTRALDHYQHAMFIGLHADYYLNANVFEGPDRLRKRMRVVGEW
jgi:hypothetical protein